MSATAVYKQKNQKTIIVNLKNKETGYINFYTTVWWDP